VKLDRIKHIFSDMEDKGQTSLNVAVEGCCHGELDLIYDTIRDVNSKGVKVDLLLVCGDFQCVRNKADLQSVAVPPKYRQLKNFHEYVTGVKVAPVTTIFIGGNHEASNILQSLYYGGWVAPNIYFLGFGGVVWFGGIRIGGLSGIYNSRHYRLGHYENPPYTDSDLRSVYHVREVEVFRMAHVNVTAYPINIFLSHDWPGNVWEFGDKQRLLSRKAFLADDMASGKLGSPPLMDLLKLLRPSLWFAAHLHVKFAAIVPHTPLNNFPSSSSASTEGSTVDELKKTSDQNGRYCLPVGGESTRFLALDKCLPGRDFLQVISVPRQYQDNPREPVLQLSYDAEWLAIMRRTHELLSTSRGNVAIPGVVQPVSTDEILTAERMMRTANGGSMVIQPLLPDPRTIPNIKGPLKNKQTDFFLNALGLYHIWTVASEQDKDEGIVPDVGVYIDRNKDSDPNELSISDDDQDGKGSSSGYKSSNKDPNQLSLSDDEDDVVGPSSISITSKKVLDERNDVINFDDESDISIINSSSFLNLPPPVGAGAFKSSNDIINDVIQF
jgi:lariat debranching enzyme